MDVLFNTLRERWISPELTEDEKRLVVTPDAYDFLKTVGDSDTAFSHRTYRKSFVLDAAPAGAILHVAARTLYKVHVNGTFVMAGPARSPERYAFVDSFPVTSFLRKRKNVIALELVYVGPRTEYDFGAPGFALDLEVDGQRVFDDDGWKEKDWRAFASRRNVKALRATYPAEYLDAGKIDRDRTAADYDDSDWETVSPVGIGPELRPRPIPLPTFRRSFPAALIDRGFIDAAGAFATGGDGFFYRENGWDIVMGNAARYAVFDLGGTKSGLFELDATIPKDVTLDCLYLEWPNASDGAPAIVDTPSSFHGFKIRGDGARISYQTWHPFSARYLCVRVPFGTGEVVTVHSLAAREWHSLTDHDRGALVCSDAALNRAVEAAKQTLRVCAPDLYVDCSSHERRIYLCDSYWEIEAGNIFFGDTAISRAFLDLFADCRGHLKDWPGMAKNGVLCCAGGSRQVTMGHNLSFVLQGFLHREFTGEAFSEAFREAATGVIADAERRVNALGLIADAPDMCGFLDWSKIGAKTGIGVGMNALYYKLLSRWAEETGSERLAARAEEVKTRLREMAAPFLESVGRNRYARLVPDAFEIVEGKLQPVAHPEVMTFGTKGQYARSEATQYFLLWSGALDPEGEDRLWEVLRDLRIDAEPRNDDNRLFAMARAGLFALWPRLTYALERGDAEVVVRDVRDICRPMTEQGDTLWETLCRDTRSNAHGFVAYAGTLLFKCLCGIRPGKNGYEDPVIAPLPVSDIAWARGFLENAKGTIGVDWRNGVDRFSLTVTSPKDTVAQVILPPLAAALAARSGNPLPQLVWPTRGSRTFVVTARDGLSRPNA